MDNQWLQAALWMGLALLATLLSVRIAISIALLEIMVGVIGGNFLPLQRTEWVNFLAGFGSILLTFLAGAEVEPQILKKKFKESFSIGFLSFLMPFLGAMAYAYYIGGWTFQQAAIAGISLSTTSVAVVYAVMIETGYNNTELGKLILAACFITDLGTVLALGAFFANYDWTMVMFIVITAVVLFILPKFTPWFFQKVGSRISEPETKFIFLLLFGLGGLALMSKSEAVLPAYLIGMVLAPFFLENKTLSHRMRVTAFTMLTPFYFLKAGSLVKLSAIWHSAYLILIFLFVKMAAKFIGVWPTAKIFKFNKKEAMYTTLLMSTGLTFGTISALFGYTNKIINQEQYTILVTAVILSAVVPTIIAQKWFQPDFKKEGDNV
ncbi:MAG: cation:proton antiporter [Nitrospirae bacterium]|jgi:Kef-type K+ transport system membrane component KefB|nr:cation:proton antiporter [Nitrospirota bacterium]